MLVKWTRGTGLKEHPQSKDRKWKLRVQPSPSRQGYTLIDNGCDEDVENPPHESPLSPYIRRRHRPPLRQKQRPPPLSRLGSLPSMKAAATPFARYPVTAFVSCGFLFATFILLLLVGISLTIIKPIYLVTFKSTAQTGTALSIATELRFGVWGVCASSGLNPATSLSNPGLCFGPQLGYDVPEYITNVVGISQDIVKAVEKAILAVLVLHPIAAGFAFLAFITSVFLGSHAFAIFSLVLTIITALLTSVVLAIDLALVIVAQDQVKNLQNFHFEVKFGNGVWMILTAVVLVWGAVLTLSARACYCMGVRRHPADKKHKHHHASDQDLTQHY